MMTASPAPAGTSAATIEQLGATLLRGKDLSAEELARVIAAQVLPAAPAGATNHAALDAPDAPATGPTVLIADDDPGINHLLQTRLRRRGFRVLTAPDGQAAWELLQRESVDLLFLDIAMPVMDGFEVLDAIRAARLDLYVVMSTAFGSETSAAEAIRRGADAFVAKPYEQEALNAAIERALRYLESTRVARAGTRDAVR
jgi:CheY-like chemotaxis protein